MRLAIIDVVEGIGPCSVATLARALGVRPDSVYYHLNILERRGLIRRRFEAEEGPQAIIDVVGRPLTLEYDTADRKNRDAVVGVVAAIVRGALRAFRRAFRPGVRVTGKRRELWAAQRTARLTKAQLALVNRKLDELLTAFDRARATEADERLYSLTFILAPQEGDD
jgi:DNA-binding transcriptional ArsR family regulator